MIIYYTDGSASPNPGPGGFSVIADDKPVVLGTEPEGSGVSARQMASGEPPAADGTTRRIGRSGQVAARPHSGAARAVAEPS